MTSLLSSLIAYLRTSTPSSKMATWLRTLLSLLLSYRTLLFLLAITNLKSLPLSWHVRLFHNMARHSTTQTQIRKRLRREAALAAHTSNPNGKPIHPIFRPKSLATRAPLGECDYNLHKSNSTYFSDLDLSRGNLVASLVGPAMRLNALVPHGIRRGLCYPILGSVHTSFLREIKPYERYEVRSRVLGWDRKWLVIGSWFVRRATRAEVLRDRGSGRGFLKGPVGEEEVVFACVLNKYVLKAGRVTVPPELALAGSGWFPVRPELTERIRSFGNGAAAAAAAKGPVAGLKGVGAVDSEPGTGTASPALGPQKVVDDAASAVQNVAIEAGRRLSRSGDKRPKVEVDDDEMPGWTWEEIEEERLRGLKIAEQWLTMDVMLRKEYEIDMERGIWGS